MLHGAAFVYFQAVRTHGAPNSRKPKNSGNFLIALSTSISIVKFGVKLFNTL
jgi:hypothetical protein